MSEEITVLIPDRLEPPADIEQQVFGEKATIHTPAVTDATAIETSLWETADVVLAWHDLEFDEELLSKLDSCKILVRVGVGYDNVDLTAAGEVGIPVCNVPDYGTNDVADHTMALLLTLWRGVPHYNDRFKQSQHDWRWETDLPMQRLTSATMAVIGLGRIGMAVARRAKAFGIDVVAYDPYLPDGYDKSLGIDRARTLEAAVSNADIVTFHTPLTDETHHMANREFFDMMPDNTVVVNTARGEIIDLDALHKALQSGTVRAAGLDVVETEPPDPDHPLIVDWRNNAEWLHGRLLFTPHAAFYCDESLAEMREKAAQTANEFITEGELRNCVNENKGFD
jgi:lactate dehydrogenase-like 2-hydroxyacid dehydrogenase